MDSGRRAIWTFLVTFWIVTVIAAFLSADQRAELRARLDRLEEIQDLHTETLNEHAKSLSFRELLEEE